MVVKVVVVVVEVQRSSCRCTATVVVLMHETVVRIMLTGCEIRDSDQFTNSKPQLKQSPLMTLPLIFDCTSG